MGKRTLGTLTKKRIAARAAWKCEACHLLVDEYYEVDHKTPLHMGGLNKMDNLQLLCYACHNTKTRSENIKKEKWASIKTCKFCKITYSLYWRHKC